MAATACLTALMTGSAACQDQALIMTAEHYENAGQLGNPANDGALFEEQLRSLGFSVTLYSDLDLAGMHQALRRLGDDADTADRVLVFFAGHGVYLDGKSRLLPTDAKLDSADALAASSVPLEEFATVAGKARKVGMIFFDACRNDPGLQSKQDGGRSVRLLVDGTQVDAGVAPPVDTELADIERQTQGTGSYILGLSTSMGQVATDGTGLNSPFSAALVEALLSDGSGSSLPKLVTDKVFAETRGRQNPVFRTWTGQ